MGGVKSEVAISCLRSCCKLNDFSSSRFVAFHRPGVDTTRPRLCTPLVRVSIYKYTPMWLVRFTRRNIQLMVADIRDHLLRALANANIHREAFPVQLKRDVSRLGARCFYHRWNRSLRLRAPLRAGTCRSGNEFPSALSPHDHTNTHAQSSHTLSTLNH